MKGTELLIADKARATLDEALAPGASTGGWLLSGPAGIGKRTVANAFVAAHLSGATSLSAADQTVIARVEGEALPDLQVLQRAVNEKTGKLNTVIRVDDVRAATERLFRTSATGRRAIIVDTADEMNVASANAMLKSLEEPPSGTLFVLLSRAVGALLPTIRSRCRMVGLPPITEDVLIPWLVARADASERDARVAGRAAGGAPGRALTTLQDPAARLLADEFLTAASGRGDMLRVAEAIGTKANEAIWPEAWTIVAERIGGALRGADDPLLAPHAGPALLAALDEAIAFSDRATGLNADRTHTALALGRTVGKALRARR